MTCGIYLLRFKDTNKVYVGQSTNIEARYKSHLNRMANEISSYKLNEAYKVYGTPSLEILNECLEHELNTFENEAIEIFNSCSEGFNSLDKADICPNLKGPLHGRSKYTVEQIEQVFNILVNDFDISYKDISNITGVPTNRISSIRIGDTHSWLAEKFPIEYELLKTRPQYKCSGKDRGITYPAIVSPEGLIYNITNMTKFANEHGLSQGSLGCVLRGSRKVHKGWKLAEGDIS